MDIINQETNYAQLVKVVNELKATVENSEDNPLLVDLASYLLTSSGQVKAIRVNDISNHGAETYVRPYTSTSLNLHISSVHVVNSGVGYVFPINLTVYNLSSSSVANSVNAVYSTYSSRFSTATSIIIFYETINSSGVVDASSYSADD